MASRKRENSMNVLKIYVIPENEDDIVSLDPPPKIVLDQWDINIVKMFSEKRLALLSATALMNLVFTYKLSLRNKTLYYAYTERLSTYIIHHLNYIHECFHDMQYYCVNMAESTNYYSLLEDVLAIYCSVELKNISKICFKPDSNNNRESGVIKISNETMYLKRLGKHAQKLAFILHNFLHRNENVLHVLMKMWYNVEAPSCVVTMRYLYTLLLHENPLTDKSEESYCRYVINYLLWIPLEKGDAKESMLGVLNKKFGYDKRPPDSAFIKKVLNFSGEKLDLDKLIAMKNKAIERYFNEIRKTNQRLMLDDAINDDLIISSDDNKGSTGVTTAFTARPPPLLLDNRSGMPPPPVPILHMHTPLTPGCMTPAARTKVQRVLPQRRTPHLENATLSILHTIAEAAQKVQFSNNEQNSSVCNSDSARYTFSDISERFAAKRAQVRNRTRPSADMNSISDVVVNPYMSPPSSSIGTPDNNDVEVVELADAGSPKCTATSICSGVVQGSTNRSANLLLYTPDSQDECEDQSFELQPRTPTGSEERDTNSGPDEDHDTAQKQRKRREPYHMSQTPLSKRRKVNGDLTSILASPTFMTLTTKGTTCSKHTSNILCTSNVTKHLRYDSSEQNKQHCIFSNLNHDRLKDDGSPTKTISQSVPDHRYPTLSPLPSRPIIPKDFTLLICYKAPMLELDPPVFFMADNGVKGFLGSDVVLLGQQASAAEASEVMRVATEMTHTEYVRDKGFVQVVSQPDDNEIISAMRETVHRRGYVITEYCDAKKENGNPNKGVLKKACVDLLLHDDNKEGKILEIGRKRPKYLINYNYPNSNHTIRIHEIVCDDTKFCDKIGMDIQQIPFSQSPTLSKVTSEELTHEEEETLNRLLQESMANMNNSNTEGIDFETRLPFKKRRLSVGSETTNIDSSYQQPKPEQRNSSSNKQSKTAGVCKEQSLITQPEISYPATKMISIAEVQEQNGRRLFKTAAERKEMPVNTTTDNDRSSAAEASANNAVTRNLLFTPYCQCNNSNRSSTILNIPPPQYYNRSGIQFASSMIPDHYKPS